MEEFKLVLSVLDAIGSISAAIGIIIALLKFRRRLKIKGEFPIKNSGTFLITVYNNTIYDNEIKSICFCKGNPKSIWGDSSIFYSIEFGDFDLEVNPNTRNAIISKGSCIEIPVQCKCVACNYEIIGESTGKLFDKIYVLVRDKKGHTYCLNTHENIDFFRRISG